MTTMVLPDDYPSRIFLAFADRHLEARYQRWTSRNYQKSLHLRLLIATFLYFILAIAFTAWAHVNSNEVQDWPHLLTVADTTMGVILSLCFLAFSPTRSAESSSGARAIIASERSRTLPAHSPHAPVRSRTLPRAPCSGTLPHAPTRLPQAPLWNPWRVGRVDMPLGV